MHVHGNGNGQHESGYADVNCANANDLGGDIDRSAIAIRKTKTYLATALPGYCL